MPQKSSLPLVAIEGLFSKALSASLNKPDVGVPLLPASVLKGNLRFACDAIADVLIPKGDSFWTFGEDRRLSDP